MPGHARHAPMRVALVGCGQIADAHLGEIARIPDATVVAVCDRHRDLAVQAAARFAVPAVYGDLADLLREARPEVVHVATPAHTHFAVARDCLLAGCHVYVEKPFTQTAAEAETLVALAAEHDRQLCAGHDQLFDPAWLALRERIARGEIGDVTHVESILGYPISGPFGSQVAADPNHWVRKLPGGLFQNTISHPLYRITEFLDDAEPHVAAAWHSRPPHDFPTDLWVQLRGARVTGSLTFCSTITSQRITRVYGSRGALEVDLDGQVIRRIGPAKAPGAFAKLLTPWQQKRDAGRAFWRNVNRFLKADIHYFDGLRNLSARFYESIRTGSAPPIAANEIVRVTRLMDRIFESARADAPSGTAGRSSSSRSVPQFAEVAS